MSSLFDRTPLVFLRRQPERLQVFADFTRPALVRPVAVESPGAFQDEEGELLVLEQRGGWHRHCGLEVAVLQLDFELE
jgi:hypothetical protein